MLRTAVRNVLAHRARLLMTVLAVMLGVAFVSGTLVFTETVSSATRTSAQKGLVTSDVVLRPHRAGSAKIPGDAPDLPQSLLDSVTKAPGVASAKGSVSGFVAVADKRGKLVSKGANSRGANHAAGDSGKDPRYSVTSGRLPRADDEVALDSRTADRAGYKVGDVVRLSAFGPVLEQRISGVFDTDDAGVAAGGSLVLFDTPAAQELYASADHYNEIAVTAASGVTQAELKSALTPLLPKEAEAVTGKKLAEDEGKRIAQSTDGMTAGMLAFAGISLFVSAFIIANTFTMLIGQRTRDLALLRAVGATRRQVTRSVLLEALMVGGIAGALGLPAGIGIGAALRAVAGSMGGMPEGPLVVPTHAMVIGLVLALVVTTLSAWLPGRRAAKIPPIAALNSAQAAVPARTLLVRNIIGALFTVAGALCAVSGERVLLGVGAGLLVIGVFVLTPLLARPVIALSAPVLRLFGMPGKLARENAVRSPRRTAATASALMVGLTLITGLTVIANGVQQAIDRMAADSLKADFVVLMANMNDLSPEVGKKIAAHPGVEASSRLSPTAVRIGDRDERVIGVDGSSIGKLISVDFVSGSFSGLRGENAVVDKDTAKKHGWSHGSAVNLIYPDGEQGTLKISGVYAGNQMIQGIMVDDATIAPHVPEAVDSQVMVKTKDGDSAAVENRLYEDLGSNPALMIQTKSDISREVGKAISVMLNILYGLLAMAVIIAVLGVVNTLALSVTERRREIGMLRAIGVSRSGVQRMIRLEAVVISLFGGLLGVGLGVFFGWAVGEQIGEAMPTYALALPWGRLALFLLLSAVIGFLAALWPARSAARTPVLEAIKAG
ncbi:ABC transporter permease [Streptomyces sp. NPDC059752]|uniref:ABC transporter permease n=1 Tax=unclassified Streptomyces TaxID=2593676 RepID=UPI00364A33B8